jgi:hypothetical protein
LIVVNNIIYVQRKIGYEQKDIEATFKEEVSQKKSEVYEIYKQQVEQKLLHGGTAGAS